MGATERRIVKIDREHLANLLEWSFDEIFSYCGDGGMNWVLNRYGIHDIHLFIRDYLQKKREAYTDRAYKNRMIPANTRYAEWEVSDVRVGCQDGESFTVFRPSEQILLVTTDAVNVPPWGESVITL